eukprot:CAMPEP_0116552232 /NCGR_PEP_ID=MMETSP0397-20121206/6377_1 /TAXON_ID=216820 /ORGANISM="Cyclophora tenuis, Strain ECT3854" /LENGTH=159 /DNA_ID=CAMNT_0004077169 /DNA_START=97 /DNA_END=573 /DNA_ORIENTATION=+
MNLRCFLLTLAANGAVAAFMSRPAFCPRILPTTTTTTPNTKLFDQNILQELAELEQELEESAPRNSDGTKVKGQDASLTPSQLASLIHVLEMIIDIEQHAETGFALVKAFATGEKGRDATASTEPKSAAKKQPKLQVIPHLWLMPFCLWTLFCHQKTSA